MTSVALSAFHLPFCVAKVLSDRKVTPDVRRENSRSVLRFTYCTYIHTHTCIRTHTHTCTYAYTHKYAHTHIYTHINTHTHTNTYMHIHTDMKTNKTLHILLI